LEVRDPEVGRPDKSLKSFHPHPDPLPSRERGLKTKVLELSGSRVKK
jgi:hypothetical protein